MAKPPAPTAPAATDKPPAASSLRAEIEEWVRTIVFGLLWYYCIITFLVEAYKIPSGSMEPTLNGDEAFMQGDRVLAVKAIDHFREPQRGDIVVFLSVERERNKAGVFEERRLVKRLVGLPGETLQILDGVLWVDGKRVEDPPIFRELRYTDHGLGYRLVQPYVVPQGHYFMLGDNSGHSKDSRYWGPLPKDHVLGRALFTWWKPGNIKSLNPKKQKLR